MKLIVITKENFFVDEARWIKALFDAGLEYLHLRKPTSTACEIETLLRKIDKQYYSRIVLHDCFQLAVQYDLGGVHLNSRNSTIPQGFKGRISCSCHSVEEVVRCKEGCSYVTLSPIFDSVSKQGYRAMFTEEQLVQARRRGIIDDKVIALGGITEENMRNVKAMGFGGAAVLGAIWNAKSIEMAVKIYKTMKENNSDINIQNQSSCSQERITPAKVLSIAGSDPSGGAGIQADIKTIMALGGYAATAITALTVQNTMGVRSVFPVPVDVVAEQIAAVMEDIEPQAVKIGMVKDAAIVQTIANAVVRYTPQFVVYDPVMVATSGDKLIDDDIIDTIERHLIPCATLLTPNLAEAQVLWNRKIGGIAEMEQAAIALGEKYGTNVLIKGGHLEGDGMCDVLCSGGRITRFTEYRIETRNLHGTGCTLSSAIATLLAKGYELEEAVKEAKAYVTATIARGSKMNIGRGNGPLWHCVF